MAPTGASLLGLTGAVTAVFCLLAILSAQVTTLKAGWMRIAVRVARSWIAAAGILMFGWLARPLVRAQTALSQNAHEPPPAQRHRHSLPKEFEQNTDGFMGLG